MARRPVAEEDSSLDLFLSTSCDAFGGIIFIMLIICLMPSKRDSAGTESPAPPAPLKIAEATKPTPTVDLLADQKAQLTQKLSALDEEMKVLAKSTDAASTKARSQESALQKMKEGLRNSDQQAVRDTRKTRTPRLHEVDKNNFYIVLQNDRVYVPIIPEGTWRSNTDDFKVTQTEVSAEFKPLDRKGKSAEQWIAARDGLQALGKNAPRDKFVIYFAVHPDSIASFNRIRDVFTGMGYDYNWTPLEPNEPLRLTRNAGKKEAQ